MSEGGFGHQGTKQLCALLEVGRASQPVSHINCARMYFNKYSANSVQWWDNSSVPNVLYILLLYQQRSIHSGLYPVPLSLAEIPELKVKGLKFRKMFWTNNNENHCMLY